MERRNQENGKHYFNKPGKAIENMGRDINIGLEG
jgi:hypothetical protein